MPDYLIALSNSNMYVNVRTALNGFKNQDNTAEKLKADLAKLGINTQQINSIITNADINGDGKLSVFENFTASQYMDAKGQNVFNKNVFDKTTKQAGALDGSLQQSETEHLGSKFDKTKYYEFYSKMMGVAQSERNNLSPSAATIIKYEKLFPSDQSKHVFEVGNFATPRVDVNYDGLPDYAHDEFVDKIIKLDPRTQTLGLNVENSENPNKYNSSQLLQNLDFISKNAKPGDAINLSLSESLSYSDLTEILKESPDFQKLYTSSFPTEPIGSFSLNKNNIDKYKNIILESIISADINARPIISPTALQILKKLEELSDNGIKTSISSDNKGSGHLNLLLLAEDKNNNITGVAASTNDGLISNYSSSGKLIEKSYKLPTISENGGQYILSAEGYSDVLNKDEISSGSAVPSIIKYKLLDKSDMSKGPKAIFDGYGGNFLAETNLIKSMIPSLIPNKYGLFNLTKDAKLSCTQQYDNLKFNTNPNDLSGGNFNFTTAPNKKIMAQPLGTSFTAPVNILKQK